jgi:sulfur carrier protein
VKSDYFINNEAHEIAEGSTINAAILSFDAKPPYAILVNDTFLPKSEHEHFILTPNNRIEVISAIQGG